ncbi:MAG TPA: HAD family phosphatase [Candidatus Saccharimonadia bacterium]|nr:HAD family phosphatase [Candidatus Saccharimonadia bacterium]
MLSITNVKGVIFDVDETLLDNGNGRFSKLDQPLHERARLQAIHEAGTRHNLPELLAITPEQNLAGFLEAPVHSLEGAVWHLLFTVGVVATDIIDPDNQLLQEIVVRKDELYETLLRTEGKALPGAIEFVQWLGDQGLAHHMAIASTAIRRDINIFLEMTDLKQYFPTERIIAKDAVTHTKPHPEAFYKAFKSLGLPNDARGQVLAFEDNPRGIASAKAAGLYACAITNVFSREAFSSSEVAPDLIADSFDEFRTVLTVAKA